LRYSESQGLVATSRNPGGQRRFKRSDLRRVSFVLIAQQLGFTLDEIKNQLAILPDERTPTQRDWNRVSQSYRQVLNERIAMLERMRDRLDGCIGCGCLSLKKCELYNPQDKAWCQDPGARYIVGDPD
jgi:MerR family redox-sensitive transcriptional activator SoxR